MTHQTPMISPQMQQALENEFRQIPPHIMNSLKSELGMDGKDVNMLNVEDKVSFIVICCQDSLSMAQCSNVSYHSTGHAFRSLRCLYSSEVFLQTQTRNQAVPVPT